MIHTCIIPAGGYGSRMEPITKAVPKPMLPIIRKPAIHYVVDEAVSSGIDRIIIVAGYKSSVIRDYFFSESEFDSRSHGPKDYFEGTDIEFIAQEQPRGLADAILCAKEAVDGEPFAVLLSDDIIRSEVPATKQLCESAGSRNTVGCLRIPQDEARKYGMLVPSTPDNPFSVAHIVEKPQNEVPSRMAVAGRYVFTPSIMNALETAYATKGKDANLTDALNLLLASGEKVLGFELDGKRYDIGDEDGYIATLKAAIAEKWRDEEISNCRRGGLHRFQSGKTPCFGGRTGNGCR